MAGSFYNNKDSMDISELASLNDDISDDLIDKLQQQISGNIEAAEPKPSKEVNESDDSTLFEEVALPSEDSQNIKTDTDETIKSDDSTVLDAAPQVNAEKSTEEKPKVEVNQNFDDNFIKKYKAKLQKRAQEKNDGSAANSADEQVTANKADDVNIPIEQVSQGKITERQMTKDLKEYNDSLDFLDGNVKYSKYVIYIDPQNIDFIEGLTVKERKNLINGILRQQDDISITKQRIRVVQAVMLHVIITLLVLALSIPVVYHAINASLEATINNHRSAQTNWQALYKEHGKITNGN